jgi:short-subunit dehydrogenase
MSSMPEGRPFAVITGASTGIGRALADCAARDGCDLLICADEARIEDAARELRAGGAQVEAVQADLSTEEGGEALWSAVGGRDVDYLCANAGAVLGHAFVEQDWTRIRTMLGLNVTGTTLLLHRALGAMAARGRGRVLVTGSIAGFVPGSHQAVYNASKAYLDSLSFALREEMKDCDVTVTCLMPGPVETPIFARGDMKDTPMGRMPGKDDPARVAEAGWEAMKAGRAGITPGLMNKLVTTFAGLVPDTILARLNRALAEPDGASGKK